MKQSLIMLFVFLLIFQPACVTARGSIVGHFVPKESLAGYGIDRIGIEKRHELLESRFKDLVESMKFVLLREPKAVEGMTELLSDYQTEIYKKAAEKAGIPVRYLQAVGYLEGMGFIEVQSPTKPLGPFQIAKKTADSPKLIGLKTGGTCGDHKVFVTGKKRIKVNAANTKTKGRRGKIRPKPRYRTKTVTTKILPKRVDERCLLDKAAPKVAAYIKRMTDGYGDMLISFWEYHSGLGVLEGTRKHPRGVLDFARAAGLPQSYKTIFFASNPVTHSSLFDELDYVMTIDNSPTYPARIEASAQLVDLAANDFEQFKSLCDSFINSDDPKVRVKNRFTAYAQRLDSEAARVEMASYKPDVLISGDYCGVIGMRHSETKRKPAASLGLILWVAYQWRMLCEKKGIDYLPLVYESSINPNAMAVKLPQGRNRDYFMWLADDLGTFGGKLGYDIDKQKQTIEFLSSASGATFFESVSSDFATRE